jgi:F0F1-type ATP synthase epsilon subunit
MALTLDIVTPRGLARHEENVDRIVVRRREADFDPGSEFAICPRHGALLMQTQACRMRVVRGARTLSIDVPPGVLEVVHDAVTLVLT